MKFPNTILILFVVPLIANAQNRKQPELFEVPGIRSSWDDLTDGVETAEDWQKRRVVLRQRYLDLIRDQYKPEKPALDLKVHEDFVVDGVYRRKLISYAVEADERAHAYLGIPLNVETPAPAIVALHGTYKYGKKRVAGLIDNPDKAYLDLSGLNDGHGPTQRLRLLMLMKVMDVYELEKSPQNFGFYVHGRGHSVAHESRQLIYGFMDSHLKPPEATQTRLVETPE